MECTGGSMVCEKSKGLEYRGLATCPWGVLGNLLTFPEPQ